MNTYTFRPHTRHFIWNILDDDVAEAERLLGRHAYIVTDRNKTQETALHWLAIESEIEGMRLLLKHGADPDSETHSGNCILDSAALLGLVDVAKTLLEAGATVNHRHRLNRETPLHHAARAENPDVVDVLLDAGAEIDARTHLGETPLHLAAQSGKKDNALRLLARGADASAVDDCGDTFLDKAPEDERAEWQAMKQAAMQARKQSGDGRVQ